MKIDYTIGDDIVCIKSHPKGIFKEGDIFTCKALTESKCKCKISLVDIGALPLATIQTCTNCDHKRASDGTYWLKANRFKKLDFDISELTEILQKEEQHR